MRQSFYACKRVRAIAAAAVAFGAALAVAPRSDAQTSQVVPANAHAIGGTGG